MNKPTWRSFLPPAAHFTNLHLILFQIHMSHPHTSHYAKKKKCAQGPTPNLPSAIRHLVPDRWRKLCSLSGSHSHPRSQEALVEVPQQHSPACCTASAPRKWNAQEVVGKIHTCSSRKGKATIKRIQWRKDVMYWVPICRAITND